MSYSGELFDPTIVIDNRHITFKPNTVKLKLGKGEIKVSALSGGAGFIETVHSEDVSTKINELTAMIANRPESAELVRQWKERIGLIKITISQNDYSISLRNCSLTNDPEFTFKPDSEVEIKFQGDPAL
jgi:hypothetical protein